MKGESVIQVVLEPKSIPVTLTDGQQSALSMTEQLFHGLGNR